MDGEKSQPLLLLTSNCNVPGMKKGKNLRSTGSICNPSHGEGSGNLNKTEGEKGNVRKAALASWRSQCFLEGPKNFLSLVPSDGALNAPGLCVAQTKHFPEFLV